MKLDHDFFQVSKSSEDQKKKSSPKMEVFPRIQVNTKKKVFNKNGKLFPPNSSEDLRSDALRSQIFGGNADEDHFQIIGRIYPPPPPPRVSPPLCALFSCRHGTMRMLRHGILVWLENLEKVAISVLIKWAPHFLTRSHY